MGLHKVTIPEIVPWLQEYYAQPDPPGYQGAHGMGGSLHIVLEDGNIKNTHLHWCEQHALTQGDDLGAFLARALLAMTYRQRKKLYLNHSFYPD